MHKSVRTLAFAAGLLFCNPILAAASEPEETRMISTITAEHERNVSLLQRLVEINSGTMNFDGVEQVGQLLAAELEPLGFEVRWIPMADAGRAGHLVATHRGNGQGKRLLLIGHLDTVFELDSPFQTWTRNGNRAVGPGVADMKGGNVIIVAALRAMHAAGTLEDADVTVFFSGDEEKVGRPIAISRRDLIAAGRNSDVALDFEGQSQIAGQDVGSIARRSSNSWTVRVTAKSGHSSGVCTESDGCGAAYELSRIIETFRLELPEPNATVNVGLISSGVTTVVGEDESSVSATGKTNIISAEAIALGDIRTLSPDQDQRVREKMRAIVARSLPHAEATLEFKDGGYPPMAPTNGNRALLRALNEVNATLGLPQMPEADPASRGAGDISFVSFIDGLVGLGMVGERAHAPGESADLRSIDIQAQRAALLMTRLSRAPRS